MGGEHCEDISQSKCCVRSKDNVINALVVNTGDLHVGFALLVFMVVLSQNI